MLFNVNRIKGTTHRIENYGPDRLFFVILEKGKFKTLFQLKKRRLVVQRDGNGRKRIIPLNHSRVIQVQNIYDIEFRYWINASQQKIMCDLVQGKCEWVRWISKRTS